MPNSEEDFLHVRRYLSNWVTEVVLSNASGYFDINRISEGFSLRLLNLIFNHSLIDLNLEKVNYPGIDLGDSENSKVAFQITSQTSSSKIISSLKTFRKENFIEVFPNGIRFLIINNKKKSKRSIKAFEEFKDIFNPKADILYPEDLIHLIKNFYYQDGERFNQIKILLQKEFGANQPEVKIKNLISFESSDEKISFYKKVFFRSYVDINHKLVHFSCEINGDQRSTKNLVGLLNNHTGLLLVGPSGCGKSMLSINIAFDFFAQGISVILECKYYETDLTTLFEQKISNLGFKNNLEFFELSSQLGLSVLLIVDGYNECDNTKKAKLLTELEKLIADWSVKIIVSTQEDEELLYTLKLLKTKITFPSEKTKIEIASNYNNKDLNNGLESIVNAVSTSLEAKMVGEIANLNIDSISRFTLFETFIKQKLDLEKSDGFFLMAKVAELLSKKLSFSLSEREIEEIIRVNRIPQSSYHKCFQTKILDINLGQVSFSHEMFFNFFVAESVIRFSENAESIIKEINSPKNYDKKLLIVGAINDINILDIVLSDIQDVNLLLSIILGEAGSYSQKWCNRKLTEILNEIEKEIECLRFVMTENELWGLGIDKSSLTEWSPQQLGFINLIYYQLSNEKILIRFFELIGKMDAKIGLENKRLEENNSKLRSSMFATVYNGFSNVTSAITKVISGIDSGILTFYKKTTISKDLITELISKGSLSHGQFYFILVLLRWNEKLQYFFEYTCNLIENSWKSLPYHLKLEILLQIVYFPKNDFEKDKLIDILHCIHQQTNNVWLSSSVFDALKALGALEADAEEHIPFVTDQINELLSEPNLDENCKTIFGLYNCSYDHPYSYAYNVAISNLDNNKSQIFHEMAVRGMTDVFLGSYLIIQATKFIGSKICPLIVRWTEIPISQVSMPQDSLQIFLLSHIILAKYNYPIISRFAKEADPPTKSLFAVAEIYYWFNRSDLTIEAINQNAKNAAEALFDSENIYAISSVFESRDNLFQRPCVSYLDNIVSYLDNIYDNTIENWYPDSLINICRSALSDLHEQKSVTLLGKDVKTEAIYIIERIGSIVDLDVLKKLTEDQVYGQAAIRAIKQLSLKET
ncbi:SMEK domain-containing protein [Chryseobacterium proteolyticum]|uniref:SMEK domain-containing protein n=1 Tax=Chryseobacterium proteolyticum TaxID=118127 RepID=UPI0039830162